MAHRAAFALLVALRPSLASVSVQATRRMPPITTHFPAFRRRTARFHFIRPRMTAKPPTPQPSPPPVLTLPSPPTHKIALLYDGDCPLCMREVNFLRRRMEAQESPPSIKLVNVASPDYVPADYAGIDYKTAMGRIHGLKPDGTVLVGVPVFRAAYEAVGLGWVYAMTKLPGIGAVVEMVYNVWADVRLQLTGRPPLEEIMRLRKEEAKKTCR